MSAQGGKAGGKPIIVIHKEEVVEGGHHGGAWKVAYADFVTAMMAFFLLMWLLNATTPDQRKGIANYFTPTNIFVTTNSGSGQPFGGHTPYDPGAQVSESGAVDVVKGDAPPVQDVVEEDTDTPAQKRPFREDPVPRAEAPDQQAATADPATGPGSGATSGTASGAAAASPGGTTAAQQAAAAAAATDGTLPQPGDPAPPGATEAQQAAARDRQERAAFDQAAQAIREAVRKDPALASLGRQLAIDITPEGLRIQILDEEKLPMFATGSAVVNERARLLLQKVAPVLSKLTEDVAIAGHTDAAPYHGAEHSNWELSADRANATRRLLVEGGLADGRIRSVSGNAARDPLLPGDPLAAANRRIAITVLRSAAAAPPPPLPEAAPVRPPAAAAARPAAAMPAVAAPGSAVPPVLDPVFPTPSFRAPAGPAVKAALTVAPGSPAPAIPQSAPRSSPPSSTPPSSTPPSSTPPSSAAAPVVTQ